MHLTRQSQIAVGILAACARSPGRFLHTQQAGASSRATREHAAKIAHLLLRAGFLTTARGRNGGIALAQPPETISLGAVLRRTQPELSQVPRQSVEGNDTAQLASIVEQGLRGFIDLMDGFSIADLVAGRAPQRRACGDCHLRAPYGGSTLMHERASLYAIPQHR